ncbi:MAG: hypothetical protein IT372_22975 [Polyangiaceae bacterium]|nr:hypothetical protein [Polyangiaceae bacterium]
MRRSHAIVILIVWFCTVWTLLELFAPRRGSGAPASSPAPTSSVRGAR